MPISSSADLIYKEECYAIRGAIYDVYRELGSGFSEDVYQEALEEEFQSREIPFERQKRISIQYKSKTLNKIYVPDLVCHGKIIIELKVASAISSAHRAQLAYYLKATKYLMGFVVNFGAFPQVEIWADTNKSDF